MMGVDEEPNIWMRVVTEVGASAFAIQLGGLKALRLLAAEV
jgi:hypothetical protein